MDWSSVVLSAAVAALVSWLVAWHMTTRQKRAEAAVEARRALRELLAPLRLTVRQYREGIRAGARRDGPLHLDDAVLAGQVLALTEHMPWWRRRLVRPRLRRIVGPELYGLAELAPPGDGEHVTGAALALLVRDRHRPEPVRRQDRGRMHEALTGPHDAPAVVDLERDLRRLSQGW